MHKNEKYRRKVENHVLKKWRRGGRKPGCRVCDKDSKRSMCVQGIKGRGKGGLMTQVIETFLARLPWEHWPLAQL